MRAATLLSATLLLLISPALAAPVPSPQGGVSASLIASSQPSPQSAPPAVPCPDGNSARKERRSWRSFWRRQTITGFYDCSATIASGNVYRFGNPSAPHGV